MNIQEKKKLLIEAGLQTNITDDLVEDAWARLQRFYKVNKEVNDKLVVDVPATEDKIIAGLRRWALWEKVEKEKITNTKKK